MSTLAHKLIEAHLTEGAGPESTEIGLGIDQTLTQDATGTMVMLELEAMQLERVQTELSAQYVDHNLIQADHKNPDDHLFLRSACQRFGVWFSAPGNGVSHPVHMQCFGKPGRTLLGSDSHTPAAGALGMLAMGAGGIEVALAMAGEPYFMPRPKIWGVHLTGELQAWCSAKDVILELLRRHGVRGGKGYILEYYGPGVSTLDAWDRHVIANMGTELGATTSIFPSDDRTREFLEQEGRPEDWEALSADDDARYDAHEEINLSEVEPLIAKPASPGNVVPVREVRGTDLYQAYVGSSANPGYRDFAIAAEMVSGKTVHPAVSFDINPASRAVLQDLLSANYIKDLIAGGARLHQAGCNGCIGMGQAPASGRNSLRTVPRNFPGRSGTQEDCVWLCSPETATASALRGCITDPRDLGLEAPKNLRQPEQRSRAIDWLEAPPDEAPKELVKGPNIATLPQFESLPEELQAEVLLKVDDDISTDEIMPAGSRVLPYRSNVPKIAEFCFEVVDSSYPERAQQLERHAIVAGENYGQGSSREHAALAPRHLGLRLVLAKSFARIHWQNLAAFGVLPLQFKDPADYDKIEQGAELKVSGLSEMLRQGREVELEIGGHTIAAEHELSSRQIENLIAGGVINRQREKRSEAR